MNLYSLGIPHLLVLGSKFAKPKVFLRITKGSGFCKFLFPVGQTILPLVASIQGDVCTDRKNPHFSQKNVLSCRFENGSIYPRFLKRSNNKATPPSGIDLGRTKIMTLAAVS